MVSILPFFLFALVLFSLKLVFWEEIGLGRREIMRKSAKESSLRSGRGGVLRTLLLRGQGTFIRLGNKDTGTWASRIWSAVRSFLGLDFFERRVRHQKQTTPFYNSLRRASVTLSESRSLRGGFLFLESMADAGPKMIDTWLILPVVICLSQRLSHACLSINKSILWNCEWLIKSVIVYLIVPYYMDNRGNSRANTCAKTRLFGRVVFIR